MPAACRLPSSALALLLAGSILSAPPALAQSVSPGATIDLGTIWLDADNPVKLRFGVTAAGVTLIDRSEGKDTEVAPRLAEALRANLRRRKAAHAPEDSAPPPAGRGQKPTSAE